MMSAAQCSGCFSKRQLFQFIVQQIAKYAVDNGLVTDFDSLVQEIICLNCADPRRLLGMVADSVERGINNGRLFSIR